MKSFLVKICLFGILLVLFDRVAFLLIQSQRPSDYKLFLESKKDFFEKEDASDILIFGDSHIADALDTRTLENCKTGGGMTSYNLGVYHSSPLEVYHIVKAAFQHISQKPQLVVLGTNPVMFERELSKGKYTPLILGNDWELVRNSKEGLDRDFVFKTFQERYLFKHIFSKLLGKKYTPSRKIESVYRGHLEFYNQIKGTKWDTIKPKREKEWKKEQVAFFNKTIDFLRSQEVEIVIVHAPIWHKELEVITQRENFRGFEKTIEDIAKKYSIEVYNPKHTLLLEVLKKEDFLNTQHLNYKGSRQFTEQFCRDLPLLLE